MFAKAFFVLLLLPLYVYGQALPPGVHSHRDKIFLSAAPAEAEFAAMAKAGVKTVIDLREAPELKGFEKAAAARAGLEFYSSPVSREGALRKSQLDEAESLVRKAEGKKVWVYCASGNRAAAWMAVHLAQAENKKPDDAIKEARGLGLTHEGMVTKVRDYLKEQSGK